MSLVFPCSCGKKWKAPDEAAGQEFLCPTCGKVLRPRQTLQAAATAPMSAAPTGDDAWAWLSSPWVQRGSTLVAVVSLLLTLVVLYGRTRGPEPNPQTSPPVIASVSTPVELPAATPPRESTAARTEKTLPPSNPTVDSSAKTEPLVSATPDQATPLAESRVASLPDPKPELSTHEVEATKVEPQPAAPTPAPAVTVPAKAVVETPAIGLPPASKQVEIPKAIRSKLQNSLRSNAAQVRGRAVKELKEYPCTESIELLLRPALQDPFPEVRKAAAECIASYNGNKQLGIFLLERLHHELEKNPKVAEQPGAPDLIRTLAAFVYPETILPMVDWFEHANGDVAYAAADGVLTAVRDAAGIRRIESLPLIALLGETRYFAGHYGFRRTLVESVIQMQCKEAVPLVIGWLPKLNGALRERSVTWLAAVSAENLGDDPAAWQKWWKENAETFQLNKALVAELEALQANVSYYGVQARTNRVIFILDTSSSMLEGTSVRNKLVDAKQALIDTLKRLPADVSFNIITFNTNVGTWKDAPMAATEANKNAAIEFVQRLVAKGRTNSYEALLTGFRTDRNVETIFFVSDGAPSVGVLLEPAAILEAIRKFNRVQRAAIHTIGVFGGAPEPGIFEQFMQRLADENEGKYRRNE